MYCGQPQLFFIKELIALNRIFFDTAEPDDANRPSALPETTVPAMAYVPIQFYTELYPLEEGFAEGTVFPELLKPFTGCEVR